MDFKDNINYDNSITPHLGKTSKMIAYHLQEILNKENIDLTKEQMLVLKKLVATKFISQKKIAEMLFRDKSSMARLLSKMEKKGYIQRKICEKDKRIKRVEPTKKGIEIFAKTEYIRKEIIAKTEKNISIEEKELLINLLKRIQNNFKLDTLEL